MQVPLGDTVQMLAGVATAAGVGVAAWQLVLAKRQAVTTFEDGLTREYRETVYRLPVSALLGEHLSEAQTAEALIDFYRYIDLTNEQIFLRSEGRVSRAAWRNWAVGIRSNLAKPAFEAAWSDIAVRASESFSELHRLLQDDYRTDPRWWDRKWWRLWARGVNPARPKRSSVPSKP